MKTIVHVHVQRLKQGLPAIIVKQKGLSKHYSKIEIQGPSMVVSDPERKRSPRTWIETNAEVIGHV